MEKTLPTQRATQLAIRGFWLVVIPSLVATLVVWAIHADPTTATNGFETWLRDQSAIVWLGVFVVATALMRYWRKALPPAWAWPMEEQSKESPSIADVAKLVGVVAVGALAALGIRAWLFAPFKVRTSSMLPTLFPGDIVVVNKQSHSRLRGAPHAPARGSLILFVTPDPALRELDDYLFKRVVGLPGDVLSVVQGVPTINGWGVPRCRVGRASFGLTNMDAPIGGELSVEWLGDATYLTLVEGVTEQPSQGPYTVKPGEVWVLGDNRNNSSDSRTWFGGKGGGVPFDAISGLADWTYRSNAQAFGERLKAVTTAALPASAAHLRGALQSCLDAKPAKTLPP